PLPSMKPLVPSSGSTIHTRDFARRRSVSTDSSARIPSSGNSRFNPVTISSLAIVSAWVTGSTSSAEFVIQGFLVRQHRLQAFSRKGAKAQRKSEGFPFLLCVFAPLREIFRGLSDRGNSLIDIALRRSKVCNTRPQREMPVHRRIRHVSDPAFLHAFHDALVQLIQINLARPLARDVTEAADAQFDRRQQLEVIRIRNYFPEIFRKQNVFP